jgi:hypothetical protein
MLSLQAEVLGKDIQTLVLGQEEELEVANHE